MTHRHLRMLAITGTAALTLALAGCGTMSLPPVVAPKTPAQAMVSARALEGSTLRLFNEYAAQRPFCNDANAKPPPFCAERSLVIEGDKLATDIHEGLAIADKVVATGVADAAWEAIAKPQTLLDRFRAFVARARGDKS